MILYRGACRFALRLIAMKAGTSLDELVDGSSLQESLQSVRYIRRVDHDLYFQRRQLEFHLRSSQMSALEELRMRAESDKTAKIKTRQKRKFEKLVTRASGTGLIIPAFNISRVKSSFQGLEFCYCAKKNPCKRGCASEI